MTVTGQLYTCRPDLIRFVNGLPLVVIELKKPGVPTRHDPRGINFSERVVFSKY